MAMNKRYLNITQFFLVIILFTTSVWAQTGKQGREFYQLTIYHYNTVDQEKVLNQYFQQALLPALHRMGITKVGVFKNLANDTSVSKSIYVLITGKSLEFLNQLALKLNKDKAFQSAGTEYINASYTNPPYTHIECILLQAFSMAPKMMMPALKAAKSERVYELRSYESATEKIFRNKVHMFNEGDEIGLFTKLNFNAIFYSEVIAGSKIPNLMYMTSFENMADREAHWKSFGEHPIWKKLSSLPEYQNNVSHIDITFLRPLDYSDF
jgi:hypothetical protein